MGGVSIAHWAMVCVAVVLLFGRGRLVATMGDLGAGLRRVGDALNENPRDRP